MKNFFLLRKVRNVSFPFIPFLVLLDIPRFFVREFLLDVLNTQFSRLLSPQGHLPDLLLLLILVLLLLSAYRHLNIVSGFFHSEKSKYK